MEPNKKTGTYRYNPATNQVEKLSDKTPSFIKTADWKKQCNPKLDNERFKKRFGETF